jgi:putative peptidoglycan lipid II flippase
MNPMDRNLAAHLTRIAFPVLFFRALVSIFTGILQTEKRFLSSCLEGIFLSITTILACLFTYEWLRADGLMLAFVLSYVLYGIVLLFLLRGKFTYRMLINWKDEYVKKMLFMSWPVILGALAKEASLVVDRMMASSLDKGTIAALYYSDRINGIFLGIFVASVGLVLYPEFSEASVKNDMAELRKSLNSALAAVMLFCIPVTVYTLIMGRDLVSVLFERGDFNREATKMTAYILSWFIFLVLPQGIREILSRAYYSLKDTKSQMLYNSIALLLNIVLNLMFVRRLGLPGLALATVISVYAGLALSVAGIVPRLGKEVVTGILKNGMKIILSCILPSIAALGIRELAGDLSPFARLLITFLPAVTILFFEVFLMNFLDARRVAADLLRWLFHR